MALPGWDLYQAPGLCEHIFDVVALREQVRTLAVFVPSTQGRNASPLENSHQRKVEEITTPGHIHRTYGTDANLQFPSIITLGT